MSDLQSLISMGFSKQRAEEALLETNNTGLEFAIEYLLVIDDGIDTKDAEKEECNKSRFVAEPEKPTIVSHSVNEVLLTRDTQAPNKTTTTTIRVRLLNGKTLSQTFNAGDSLNDVLMWIRPHIPTESQLMTTYPKKVFTDVEYRQSLDTLNLVPSAVLIVAQLDKWRGMKEHHGTTNDDDSRKVEEKRRKEEIEKRSKEMEEERLALERVRIQIEDDKNRRRQRWPNLYPDQPLGNQLLSNQPSRALLPRNDSNQNKKTE